MRYTTVPYEPRPLDVDDVAVLLDPEPDADWPGGRTGRITARYGSGVLTLRMDGGRSVNHRDRDLGARVQLVKRGPMYLIDQWKGRVLEDGDDWSHVLFDDGHTGRYPHVALARRVYVGELGGDNVEAAAYFARGDDPGPEPVL